MIEPSSDRGQGRGARPGATRILLIEDDAGMQRIVSDHFADHDVDVTPAINRAEAEKRLAEADYDLVVLDLRLGLENGLDLLRDLRARSDLPVIITTGHRRDEIDRVIGLELGADDYLVKPYGLRELLARVRVVLRRAEVAFIPARTQDSHRSRFEGWVLDRRRRRLTNPEGAEVALSKGEYALLLAFLDAPQRPLSREHLLQATRVHEDVFDRSIDVQILRLRRKLEADPSAPRLIVTERGIGYVLAVAVERV
ncbi:response regulator [Methylobacterium frigidaeris]|nr:response regulator [Methylobacterium frigidaeris]